VSETPTFKLDKVEELSPDAWSGLTSLYSASVDAAVKRGGAVAVLLPAADVNVMAALSKGEEPDAASSLPDDELDAYKAIFEPCLGGGAGYFKEKYAQTMELENPTVRAFTAESTTPLTEMLGANVVMATFSFKSPEPLDSSGALLFAESLESVVPAGPSALEPGPVPEPGRPDSLPFSAPQPANVNRVLDIQLTATARLGRVEMPIGEILALGPGSILEVGHLVDEPVELLVNNKLVARGDVVVVDEKFGLRITEIVSPEERIESLRG